MSIMRHETRPNFIVLILKYQNHATFYLTLPQLSVPGPVINPFFKNLTPWWPASMPSHYCLWPRCINSSPHPDLQCNDPTLSPIRTTHPTPSYLYCPPCPQSPPFSPSLFKLLNILGENNIIRRNDFCACVFFQGQDVAVSSPKF